MDVSLGTVRTILVISGSRWLAALLGFFEVGIWALALGGMVAYLDRPLALIAYAGGFAAGTLVGLLVEDRIALGYRAVQVISRKPEVPLANVLREQGFRATQMQGFGRDGPVDVVYVVIRRRRLRPLLDLLHEVVPDAFVSVERADRPSGGGFTTVGTTQRWFRGAVRK